MQETRGCLTCVLVTQSCLTLCNPMGYSPPDFSLYRVLQASVLEWVAIPLSRGSSWPRDRTLISCIAGRFFTIWATGKSFFFFFGVWHRCIELRFAAVFHGRVFKHNVNSDPPPLFFLLLHFFFKQFYCSVLYLIGSYQTSNLCQPYRLIPFFPCTLSPHTHST